LHPLASCGTRKFRPYRPALQKSGQRTKIGPSQNRWRDVLGDHSPVQLDANLRSGLVFSGADNLCAWPIVQNLPPHIAPFSSPPSKVYLDTRGAFLREPPRSQNLANKQEVALLLLPEAISLPLAPTLPPNRHIIASSNCLRHLIKIFNNCLF
jgi:hypothetical protein